VTLGQLRHRLGLGTGLARAPGPRAVEDSWGEDTDWNGGGGGGEEATTGGEGDGEGEVEEEEEGEEDEDEEEEEDEEEAAEPRNLRAHVLGASPKGVIEDVRLQRLPPGARSEPGFPRARLPAPGRVADNAVQDDSIQQPVEEEEEGDSNAPVEAAALAYNVEAKRVGRPLNVFPPVGAAGAGAGAGAGTGVGGGAGTKRLAQKTPATPMSIKKTERAAPTTLATPANNKKMKL